MTDRPVSEQRCNTLPFLFHGRRSCAKLLATNHIRETQKACLLKRIAWQADNIQLLRRSAEDVAQDARQWVVLFG